MSNAFNDVYDILDVYLPPDLNNMVMSFLKDPVMESIFQRKLNEYNKSQQRMNIGCEQIWQFILETLLYQRHNHHWTFNEDTTMVQSTIKMSDMKSSIHSLNTKETLYLRTYIGNKLKEYHCSTSYTYVVATDLTTYSCTLKLSYPCIYNGNYEYIQ